MPGRTLSDVVLGWSVRIFDETGTILCDGVRMGVKHVITPTRCWKKANHKKVHDCVGVNDVALQLSVVGWRGQFQDMACITVEKSRAKFTHHIESVRFRCSTLCVVANGNGGGWWFVVHLLK